MNNFCIFIMGNSPGTVLVLAGIGLIFFLVAGTVLCV